MLLSCKKDPCGQCYAHHELHHEVQIGLEGGTGPEKSFDWQRKQNNRLHPHVLTRSGIDSTQETAKMSCKGDGRNSK